MYERFTDRARKVMQLACQEAQHFNQEYMGTEHLLLGLVKEGSGVAANVLKSLNIDLCKIRPEVEKIIQSGPGKVTMSRLPQTPRVKKAIEYAIEEARTLNHNYVGTEHLLLGLLREGENVGTQVLMNLGLKLSDVRKEVLQILGYRIESEEAHIGRTVVRRWSKPDQSQEAAMIEMGSRNSSSQIEILPSADRERIRSLERQLWNLRVLLGATVGAIAGALLRADKGVGVAVEGLILGGILAGLGGRILGTLAGGILGAQLAFVHLGDASGGVAGALLGALAGFLIFEIGEMPGERGFFGFWRKR